MRTVGTRCRKVCAYHVDKAGRDVILSINVAKTRTLLFGKTDIQNQIVIGDEEIETLQNLFTCSLITSENDCTRYIKRIDNTEGVFAGLNTIILEK